MRYTTLAITLAVMFGVGCSDKCEIVDKNGTVLKTFKAPEHIKTVSTLDSLTTVVAKDLTVCRVMARVKNEKVAIASFVPNGDVAKTSDFGRMFAESLASKLHSAGVETLELKSMKGVAPSTAEQGEFALSRELKSYRSQSGAKYAVAGVYDILDGVIVLNAKLLDLESGSVLAVSSVELTNDAMLELARTKKTIKLVAQKKEEMEVAK